MSKKIDLNKILEEIEKEAGGSAPMSQNFSQNEIKEMMKRKIEKKEKIIDRDQKR
jgi:hypothetical protein